MIKVLSVTLRVMGKTLVPDAVSTALQLTPTHSHSRGDANVGKNGRRYSPFGAGVWMYGFPQSEASVEDQIQAALTALESKADAIRGLCRQGLDCKLLVGLRDDSGNFGFLLSTSTTSLLNALSLPIDFDIYFAERAAAKGVPAEHNEPELK